MGKIPNADTPLEFLCNEPPLMVLDTLPIYLAQCPFEPLTLPVLQWNEVSNAWVSLKPVFYWYLPSVLPRVPLLIMHLWHLGCFWGESEALQRKAGSHRVATTIVG